MSRASRKSGHEMEFHTVCRGIQCTTLGIVSATACLNARTLPGMEFRDRNEAYDVFFHQLTYLGKSDFGGSEDQEELTSAAPNRSPGAQPVSDQITACTLRKAKG